MTDTNQPSAFANSAEQLARLADMLGLEIAPDDLKALANQLGMLEALEQLELQDYPPILKMDADWYE